jgi:hypothetical protein
MAALQWAMKRYRLILLSFFLSLGACTTAPIEVASTPAVSPPFVQHDMVGMPSGLYFADHEEPDQFGYQVYLLFVDKDHFTWWRTDEPHAVVLGKLDYYLSEHPGTRDFTSFVMNGNRLNGLRKFEERGRPGGLPDLQYVQRFDGMFDGELLTMRMESGYVHPAASNKKPLTYHWRFKRIRDSVQR